MVFPEVVLGYEMQCTKPVRIFPKNTENNPWKTTTYPTGLLVPCGKCVNCRIAKRTEWVTRMLHEMSYHSDCTFITLTYSDKYLPTNASLRKEDLQKFFKRLRKSITPVRIKYYACGEYGDKYGRPHYHAIIFGLGVKPYDQSVIDDAWPYGIVHHGLAERDSIRYVAQYIDKKLSGEQADRFAETGREPVFRVCSIGIGGRYADDNPNLLLRGYLRRDGKEVSIPRYYLKRTGIVIPKDSKLISKSKEFDAEIVEHYTELKSSSEDLYMYGNPDDYHRYESGLADAKVQRDLDTNARIAQRNSKF